MSKSRHAQHRVDALDPYNYVDDYGAAEMISQPSLYREERDGGDRGDRNQSRGEGGGGDRNKSRGDKSRFRPPVSFSPVNSDEETYLGKRDRTYSVSSTSSKTGGGGGGSGHQQQQASNKACAMNEMKSGRHQRSSMNRGGGGSVAAATASAESSDKRANNAGSSSDRLDRIELLLERLIKQDPRLSATSSSLPDCLENNNAVFIFIFYYIGCSYFSIYRYIAPDNKSQKHDNCQCKTPSNTVGPWCLC